MTQDRAPQDREKCLDLGPKNPCRNNDPWPQSLLLLLRLLNTALPTLDLGVEMIIVDAKRSRRPSASDSPSYAPKPFWHIAGGSRTL